MRQTDVSKGRKITSWILTILLGLLFIMAATMKLIGIPDVAAGFNKYGLGGREILIGTGELISIILFIIPKTSSIGVLLLSGLMGGAIATHMEHGEMFIGPAFILLLIWIAYWLRHPEMLSSFTKK